MAYAAFPKDLCVLSFGRGSKASVANGPQILLCHPCEDQSIKLSHNHLETSTHPRLHGTQITTQVPSAGKADN